MALLIVDLDKHIGNATAWRDTFAGQLPDLEIRVWPDAGKLADIEYLAFMHPDFDALPTFPNLKAMFSRSAGVESFVDHPKLPKAPLCKVEPPGGDPMMTEYVVMHVLRFHRDMPGYQAAQANREWRRTTIVRPEQRRVGFLGFGKMAKAPALVLKSLGFKVSAWVRHPRDEGDVPIYHGAGQLEPFLRQTDIAVKYTAWSLVFILPDTSLESAQTLAEKLRQVAATTRPSWGEADLTISAIVAESSSRPGDEPEDRVTEWINRAEAGLDEARQRGGNTLVSLATP